MSVEAILHEHKEILETKEILVKFANNNVQSCYKQLSANIVAHYAKNPSDIVDFESLFSKLPYTIFCEFITAISNVRPLKGEELTYSVLRVLEGADENKVFTTSEIVRCASYGLSDSEKLRVALFSSGCMSLSRKYSVLGDHLIKKYSLPWGFADEKNYIAINGFDCNLNESEIQFNGYKDCEEGLDTIANNLSLLIKDGYQSERISVAEVTCGYFHISIKDEDGLPMIPTLCDSYGNDYIGQGNSFEEQMLDVLKFVVKNHYSSSDELISQLED